MKTEFEVKFYGIDVDKIRNQLKELGFSQKKEKTLFKRATFDISGVSGRFVRVRDEGDRVTVTMKIIQSMDISGVQEIEVEVSNFEDSLELLNAAHLIQKSYEENYRESWAHNETEVTFDSWPLLDTFIEIEAKNETDVKELVNKLELDMNGAIYGTVSEVYLQVKNINLKNVSKLTFDEIK